jgi:hypothetical protein
MLRDQELIPRNNLFSKPTVFDSGLMFSAGNPESNKT